MVRPLENTLIKLLKSLDFYQDEGRTKIAIGESQLNLFLSPMKRPVLLDMTQLSWTIVVRLVLLGLTSLRNFPDFHEVDM